MTEWIEHDGGPQPVGFGGWAMSDLSLAWFLASAITMLVIVSYWGVRELHRSRYPDRFDLSLVIVLANVMLATLAFKVLESGR